MFSEINITPLTDVALVLLIIFMIAAPLIVESGIKVNRPGAVTSDVQPEKAITISVTADNKVYLANTEIKPVDMIAPLSLLLSAKNKKIVEIDADKKSEHGTVIAAADAAKRAGADKIFFSTTPVKPEKMK